jgi:hydroxyacylglutathione hydrolase
MGYNRLIPSYSGNFKELTLDYLITPISLPLPLNFSKVNSYLVNTGNGFILVDTGMTNARGQMETALDHLCSHPGDLKLILLTHGDFDHTGNAAYLRGKFNAPIAMHPADAGMLENGDMFWNRKLKNPLMKKLAPLVICFRPEDECTPDIFLEDGASLQNYGLDATALNTPGHSSGSLCVLTRAGDLLCGDLFTSSGGRPRLNSLMYDLDAGKASLGRLQSLHIKTAYPGHGEPFQWKALVS